MTIAHISDTHNGDYLATTPPAQVLIHSGDFIHDGTKEEIDKFLGWFEKLPHPYKIIVCGNHERGLDKIGYPGLQKLLRCDAESNAKRGGSSQWFLLEDQAVVIEGVKFYGSPWNNSSMAWGMSSSHRAKKWEEIPQDTDVLITHIPPIGIFDLAWTKKDVAEAGKKCALCDGNVHPQNYAHWGCAPLREKVKALRVPLHLYGHVHDETGIKTVADASHTVFSNAAMDIDKTPNLLHLRYRPSTGTPLQSATHAAVSLPYGTVFKLYHHTADGHTLALDLDSNPSAQLQHVWFYSRRKNDNQKWLYRSGGYIESVFAPNHVLLAAGDTITCRAMSEIPEDARSNAQFQIDVSATNPQRVMLKCGNGGYLAFHEQHFAIVPAPTVACEMEVRC